MVAGPVWTLNVPQISYVEGLVLSLKKVATLEQDFVEESYAIGVYQDPKSFISLLPPHTASFPAPNQ